MDTGDTHTLTLTHSHLQEVGELGVPQDEDGSINLFWIDAYWDKVAPAPPPLPPFFFELGMYEFASSVHFVAALLAISAALFDLIWFDLVWHRRRSPGGYSCSARCGRARILQIKPN